MEPISLRAQEIFNIGSFPVTNTLILSVLVTLFLIVVGVYFRNKLAFIPGKLQGITEIIIGGTLSLMTSVLGSEKKAEKYLPLVFTVFIFILAANWIGLIPGVGSLVLASKGGTPPILRSPASDLNFTLALALIAVTFVNAFGVAAVGLKSRIAVFFNFKSAIDFFVGILEIISEFAKIISFSFRLFGNVFAGEVLLAVMAFLVPYVMPLPFLFLEIFDGFIQAFIFGMLILVFVGIAVSHGEDFEEHAIEGHAV